MAGDWLPCGKVQKITILHVYKTYFPDTQGGLEETIRQICLNTSSFGFRHLVFTLSTTPKPRIISLPEAEVIRFPQTVDLSSCGMSLTGALGFKSLVKKADLVHYHYPWPYGDFLHFICSVKKPTLVSYQSDIVRQKVLSVLYAPLRIKFLKSVQTIVATSPNYLKSSPVLSRLRSKVKVIPNGLSEAGYPEPSYDEIVATEKKYGRNFFLFVGMLRYYKGLQYLLEASRGQPFQVLIAGRGPMEGKLKQQADELCLENVHFLGHIDDGLKNCLLRLSLALVFPSHERSEAFGMTLLEAAMTSTPLITTDIGTGTSFVNQHEQTGLVVPPADSGALQQAMLRFFLDREFADSCGKKARLRFENIFTGEKMGAGYANLYRTLLV